jgi:hypothetical protein
VTIVLLTRSARVERVGPLLVVLDADDWDASSGSPGQPAPSYEELRALVVAQAVKIEELSAKVTDPHRRTRRSSGRASNLAS